MWWRRKQNTEPLPWYRSPEYKGNLSEAEKRQLDAFRMQEQHPATGVEDLPDEVQSYIGRIEIDLYDLKQENAISHAFSASLIGAVVLYASYFGVGPAETIWPYVGGLLLLIVPWFFYRSKFKKNAKEFRTSTDELIKQEWELEYLVEQKRKGQQRNDGR